MINKPKQVLTDFEEKVDLMRLLSNELYKNITTSKLEEYNEECIKIDSYPDTRKSATAIRRQIIEMRSLLMEISKTIYYGSY